MDFWYYLIILGRACVVVDSRKKGRRECRINHEFLPLLLVILFLFYISFSYFSLSLFTQLRYTNVHMAYYAYINSNNLLRPTCCCSSTRILDSRLSLPSAKGFFLKKGPFQSCYPPSQNDFLLEQVANSARVIWYVKYFGCLYRLRFCFDLLLLLFLLSPYFIPFLSLFCSKI